MATTETESSGSPDVSGAGSMTYRPGAAPKKPQVWMVPGIPYDLSSHREFINAVREGIPGTLVKSVIESSGMRDIFVGVLNVSSSNLSRLYMRKHLDRGSSENVLDTVRLLNQAGLVWESEKLVKEWLNSPVPALNGDRPIDLIDTSEGRRWVSKILTKIEHGEFS